MVNGWEKRAKFALYLNEMSDDELRDLERFKKGTPNLVGIRFWGW